MSLINPMEWIANRVGSITPVRPPMIYVAHPVEAVQGEVLATCRECGRAITCAPGDPAVSPCSEHDSPVVLTREREPIVMFNLQRAMRWWQWLHVGIPQCVWIMPWYVNVLANGSRQAMLIEQGLRDDCEVVKRCDAVMLCGPIVREGGGMELEARTALEGGIDVFQLRGFQREPPRINIASAAPWSRWVP